jgi:hypothetical protein
MNVAKKHKTTRQTSGSTPGSGVKSTKLFCLERKPRRDSPLRKLPAERQRQIIASLEILSQKDVIAGLLQTDHIEVSSSALSHFRKWYLARSQALDELILARIQSVADQYAATTPLAPADSPDAAQSPADSTPAPDTSSDGQ